jgi:hypothetical protein
MEAHEKPHWLTEDCWPTKYAVIAKDMMSVTTVATGARAGLVAKAPKKKGRRKNSELALELLQQQQYGASAGDTGEEWGNGDSDHQSVASDAHVVAGKVMRKRKEVRYRIAVKTKQSSSVENLLLPMSCQSFQCVFMLPSYALLLMA